MGAAVSSSHISATPSSSEGGPLTLCPCSSVGSLPRETVLHKMLQHGFFPQAAVLHKLLQHGSLPQGHKPCQQTYTGMAPFSTGPQALPGACSSTGFPWGHSLLQASPCSGTEPSRGCRWIPATPWTSMGCSGQPASPWSSPQAAGEPLLRLMEHLLPLLLH